MIVLPFPPASLSGHAKGNWHVRAAITKRHRNLAYSLAKEARWDVPEEGDIRLHITFIPPDNRGDRVNFPARCKPLIDGIADALGVNDKRFVPQFYFCEPQAPGRVEVRIGA